MAGTIVESKLTRPSSAVRFALATNEDDLSIRRLLRENPMRGAISVSFEREPNYFRGTEIAGADDQTILAFDRARLVCIGRCSVRYRYINGAIHRVGYLSDLRLDSAGCRVGRRNDRDQAHPPIQVGARQHFEIRRVSHVNHFLARPAIH